MNFKKIEMTPFHTSFFIFKNKTQKQHDRMVPMVLFLPKIDNKIEI
jgi:hypothetical protein